VNVTEADHRDAAAIATDAGRLLLELRQRGANTETLRADGDRLSNDLILRALAERHPDDAVLSEESRDDPARLDAARVWIVDPLDGTREFGEAGRPDWAVHVALVMDSRPVAGAVALPAVGVTLSTAEPPTLPRSSGRLRVIGSRSRLTDQIRRLVGDLDAELVLLGSAGAKAMAVVRGEAEVYAHTGGQYEWDSAAPVAVAAAAGLHVSRIDGSPLVYNRPDPYLPDLLICRPELAERVIAAFGAG
jgi:3'(2'), 5'-bisphosphate nucleotidase